MTDLPVPIITGSAIAHLIDPMGRPLKGNVIIRYWRSVILADGTEPPTTIVARSRAFPLDDEGNVSCGPIIVADSPGLRWDMAGLGATATFALTDQDGNKRPRGEVRFQLTQAEPIKDLTEVAPIDEQGNFPTFPEMHQVPTVGIPGHFLKLISVSPLVYQWAPVPGGSGGTVLTVNEQMPDDAGNVELTAEMIGAQPAGDYIDDAQLAAAIETATEALVSTTQMNAAIDVAIEPLPTTDEMTSAINAAVSGLVDDGELASAIADATADLVTSGQLTATLLGYAPLTGGHISSAIMPTDPNTYGAAKSADLDNVFTIAQDALTTADAAIPATQKGAANGVATLDGSGQVPSAQLPSYVDDVLEFASFAALPATGESGKIYITTDTTPAREWRWAGSAYAQIVASPGSTDAVPEGSVNKYYTDARAQAANVTALNTKLTADQTHAAPVAFSGGWLHLKQTYYDSGSGPEPLMVEGFRSGAQRRAFWLNENGSPRGAAVNDEPAMKLFGPEAPTGGAGTYAGMVFDLFKSYISQTHIWGVRADGNPIIGSGSVAGVNAILLEKGAASPAAGSIPIGTLIARKAV
jgi:hypothetical protein